MTDLHARLDVVRQAVAEAGELLPRELADRASDVVEAVDRRLGHLGETVVVALAGGTGSGKSSILNALAGERIVEAGVLRPTTDHAVAWVPRGAENALHGLLADLGIDEVHDQDVLPHLAVVDLPDLDSVEEANRAIADTLVRRVDAVVWVVDPTKYNDALLHDRYLRPRRAHADQFVVAVNQIDRLTTDEWQQVEADLRATLARDGLADVPVIGVAADPSSGAPQRVGALRDLVAERFRSKQVTLAKLHTDLTELTAELRDVFGETTGVAPRERVFAEAADAIARGIIDDTEVGRAGDVGARVAARTSAGPVGLVGGAVRGSPVGRVLGLGRDAPLDTSLLPTTARRTALLAPATMLQTWVTDLSVAIGGPLGLRARLVAGDVDDVVHAAAAEARSAVDRGLEVPVRGSWRLLGVLRTLLALAVVGAVVAVWADPGQLAPGSVPVAVLVALAGLVGWVVAGRAARASGRSRGEELALEHRGRVAEVARESLDFRLGRPLDDVIATRDRLHAAIREVTSDQDGDHLGRGAARQGPGP